MVLVLQAPPGRGLLEAARHDGGKARVVIDVEPGLPSFALVVTESAAIVRGTIREMTTRLSDDEERVVTRFEIVPVRVYKGNVAPIASKPGQTQPLIVQRNGGELTIDGLQVGTYVNIFPDSEWFRDGEDVFLFLSPGATTGVYSITGGAFGAYRIVDGQVTAMTRATAMARHEQPDTFARFENRVLNLIRK